MLHSPNRENDHVFTGSGCRASRPHAILVGAGVWNGAPYRPREDSVDSHCYVAVCIYWHFSYYLYLFSTAKGGILGLGWSEIRILFKIWTVPIPDLD